MKKDFSKIYYPFCLLMIFAFTVGIFVVNFYSENWYNMDVYGDAMYAKYSYEAKSVFPDNWIFGNQFYVAATPNVAALIYSFCGDTVLSLAIASCIMTVLCVIAFVWCMKPFAQKKSIAVGLLSFIGAGIIGSSAAVSSKGFQVFFTMGSYYACYLIGILFTLGIWLRLYYSKKVNPMLYILCFAFNFALGIQSLREMLVLNLPLCAVSLFLVFFKERPWKKKLFSKENIFALTMFIANLLGVVLLELLKNNLNIAQNDILITDATFFDSFITVFRAFVSYAGFVSSLENIPMFIYKNIVALINLGVVTFVVLTCVKKYFKTKELKPIYIVMLFSIISLLAVAAAGILFIRVRHIYYFVWHILVAVSYLYAFENLKDNIKLNKAVLAFLAVLAIVSFGLNFGKDYVTYQQHNDLYHEMADTFNEEGITHILYDDDHFFELGPRIASCSDDTIVTAGFAKDFETGEGFNPDLMLCGTDWHDFENYESSYVMMTPRSFDDLELYGMADYFLENAELKHSFFYNNMELQFYSVTEELYKDIITE